MSKLLAHPPALCNIVRRIAYDAGDIILSHFDESGFAGADEKHDGSPVTVADREAETFICKALTDAVPGVPIISEEAAARGECPSCDGADYFWLVDALDGTRQFIAGDAEFTVNIALVHKGAPILGVVYAPVFGEMYSAHGEGTAARWSEETDKDKPIRVREPRREGLTVMVSKHGDLAQVETYLEPYKVEKIIRRGSSLKICAIAAGKADMYPRFGATSQWDTAAAHAVLLGAGGDVVDMQGRPLSYGGKTFANPDFVARTPGLSADEGCLPTP